MAAGALCVQSPRLRRRLLPASCLLRDFVHTSWVGMVSLGAARAHRGRRSPQGQVQALLRNWCHVRNRAVVRLPVDVCVTLHGSLPEGSERSVSVRGPLTLTEATRGDPLLALDSSIPIREHCAYD
ncbi:hypothetical protein A0H81_02518 [Grifola frondosa]|uniref:Uncharacterized protein n=1 Tax=Grifola frondosa TaxID=5627 RepID=A0A1C7MK08_GRIFR|nr:hypothetical protein A0H81_02518 [Grifola frondosa]